MGTISPLFADAFRLLRDDLYGQLDDAEFLATKCEEWSERDIDGLLKDPEGEYIELVRRARARSLDAHRTQQTP